MRKEPDCTRHDPKALLFQRFCNGQQSLCIGKLKGPGQICEVSNPATLNRQVTGIHRRLCAAQYFWMQVSTVRQYKDRSAFIPNEYVHAIRNTRFKLARPRITIVWVAVQRTLHSGSI